MLFDMHIELTLSKETKVPWLHMSLYVSVWWNWCVMCDDWVI